jgi:hypothetical protein
MNTTGWTMPKRGRRRSRLGMVLAVGLAIAVLASFARPSQAEPTVTFDLFDADATGYDWVNDYLLAYLSHNVYLDSYAPVATEDTFKQAFTDRFASMGLTDIDYFTDHSGAGDLPFNTDTEVIVAESANAIFVVFRGTEGMSIEGLVDWLNNGQFNPAADPIPGMHTGFSNAAQTVYADVTARIDAVPTENGVPTKKVWITGHSLGGALATATATFLEYGINGDPVRPVQGLVTFGAPRVFTGTAAATFDTTFGTRAQRFVDNEDLVPHVPPPAPNDYTHIGQLNNIIPDGAGGCVLEVDTTELGIGLSIDDHAMSAYLKRMDDDRPADLRFSDADNFEDLLPDPPDPDVPGCSASPGLRDAMNLVVNPGESLVNFDLPNLTWLAGLQALAAGLTDNAGVAVPDFGIGNMAVNDARIDADLGTRTLAVSGTATLPLDPLDDNLTAQVGFRLEVGWDDDTSSMPSSVKVHLDGSTNTMTVQQVIDVVAAAFPDASVDADQLGAELTLHGPVLTFSAEANRVSFSGLATAELPTRGTVGAGMLHAEVLLAFTADPGNLTETSSLLAAMRIADPGCSGGTCIHLGRVLPIPDESLAATLEMPAIDVAVVIPNDAAFDPNGLEDDAKQFLEDVARWDPSDATDMIDLPDGLTINAEVPLAPLAPVWDALGIEFTDLATAQLGLTGELGFDLSALSDSGTPPISKVDLTMTGPSMTVTTPDFPDWFGDTLEWPTTGDWELFLRYAAGDVDTGTLDTLELGLSLPGITTTLIDNPATTDVEVGSFSIEAVLLTSTEGTVVRFRGAMATPWVRPFDIPWLTVTEVALDASLTVAGGELKGTVDLTGTFDLGGKVVSIALALDGLDEASLRVDLLSTITVDDVITTLVPVGDRPEELPPAVTSAGFGPGELLVTVTSDKFRIDATVDSSFTPFGEPIGVSAIFTGDFTGTTPVVAIGVRPSPGLMLSDVLPTGVALPTFYVDHDGVEATAGEPMSLDLELVPDDPNAGFGFVFASDTLTIPNDPDSPVTKWFNPLFGGTAGGRTIDSGPGVLGAFTLPEPLDAFAHQLGMLPSVFASGNIPLPSPDNPDAIGMSLSLGLELDSTQLPDLMSRAGGTLAFRVEDKAIKIQATLELGLLIKQGFDPAVADVMEAAGLQAPRAEPLPLGHSGVTCPRGGIIASAVDPEATDPGEKRDYCVDPLTLTGFADLGFKATPPSIVVGLGGSLVSDTAPGGDRGWSPFGLDFMRIRSLIAKAEVSVTPTPPAVGIALGMEGTISLLLPNPDDATTPNVKSLSGAIKAGVDIRPGVPPVVAVVTPRFEGVRVAFPEGLGTADLLDLQQMVADLAGAPDLRAAALDLSSPIDMETVIPDVAMRNLEFSFSPLGVPDLCIPLGIIARGELWLNPAPGSTPGPPSGCDPATWVPDPIPPADETCAAKKDKGCVAGMFLSFTPSGIAADGFLAGFDMHPFPMRFDDAEVSLRLTLQQQFLKLAGGVWLGEQGDTPWAGGDLAINIAPTELEFIGQLEAFGYQTYAYGQLLPVGNLSNPLDLLKGGINPSMELRLYLADHTTGDLGFVPDLDFGGAVLDLASPVLNDLESAAAFIDALLSQLTPQGALNTLLALPAQLEQAHLEVDLPPWLTDLTAAIEQFTSTTVATDDGNKTFDLSEYGTLTLDALLNGVKFGGVPGFVYPASTMCVDVLESGEALIEAILSGEPFDESLLDNLEEGTVIKILGVDVCWSDPPAFLYPGVLGIWFEPTCFGLTIGDDCWLLPPIEFASTLCKDWFPDAAKVGTPGGTDCTIGEVEDAVEDLLATSLGGFLDLTGIPDLTDVLDTILAYMADPDPGALFGLDCAEARLLLSLQDGNRADMAVDLTVFGQPVEFGLGWDFDNAQASAEKLLSDFWKVLTGSPPGGTFSCGGIPEDVFGPDGIGIQKQSQIDAAASGDPDVPPPPLTLTTSVSPSTVVENGMVTVTGHFNRPVLASDGVSSVSVAWGEGSPTVVPIAIGDEGFTAVHTYLDDNPSGTSSDVYTIHVTGTGLSSNTKATVRNDPPRNVHAALTSASIDEGDSAELTVTFTDAGPYDTHKVTILWGDGSSTVVNNASSGVVRSHSYRDDDPTGGPGPDPYTIKVVVEDDDLGLGTTSTVVHVSNVDPDADSTTLSPGVVNEGQVVRFTVDFDDVGVDDSHVVDIDWGDGTTSRARSRAGQTLVRAVHAFVDDNPTDTPQDDVIVTITVTDDDGGTTTVERTVTVRNVAPTVCMTIDPDAFEDVDLSKGCPDAGPLTIDEGDDVTVSAVFTDPGLADTHEVVIDWGNDALADTEVELTDGERSVSGTRTYGDNGTFTVTITVTDDDTGSASTSATVTVLNVDPTITIDETAATPTSLFGTVLADGPDDNGVLDTPTFLRRAGVGGPFSARATDPGSDDLHLAWDWDVSNRFDPTTSLSDWFFVNPPLSDPLPSPTVDPRDVTYTASHAWQQACLYQVRASAADDDGGIGTDDTWVVVTGTDDRLRQPGWWYNQYDTSKSNKNTLSNDTLTCYLEAVSHLSRVFDTFREMDTFLKARDVLNTKKTSAGDEIMVRQLAASWLNLVHGSIGWFDLVDTDGDRVVDTAFHDVLRDAEAVRMDPSSTRQELLTMEDVLKGINGG